MAKCFQAMRTFINQRSGRRVVLACSEFNSIERAQLHSLGEFELERLAIAFLQDREPT